MGTPEVIDRFEDAYWFLSNFSPSPIEWCGREWPTVEHAYQAAKNYSGGAPLNEAAVEEIRTAPTPNRAKKLGRKIYMVPEWDRIPEGWEWGTADNEPLKLSVMRELLGRKFDDPALRDALLATGDAELVEGNWWGDRVWGVCEGEGTNWLGRLLMELRSRLRGELRE